MLKNPVLDLSGFQGKVFVSKSLKKAIKNGKPKD